jgi:HEAT repeat protein
LSETRRLLLDFETDEVARLAKDDTKVRGALIQAFSDSSEIVRERALIAAIELGDPHVVTDASKALSDDDSDVRIAAAQLLAWYGQPRSVLDLLKGIKDSNTWVKSHCAAGLSKLLPGPVWARVPGKDIDLIVSGFPGMDEEEIERFLTGMEIQPEAVDRFMTWREAKFNIEIDMTKMIQELEARPIILTEETRRTSARPIETPGTMRGVGLSPGVERIVAELPEEIRATLPPEDLRRLNVTTARELVDSLKASFPDLGGAEGKKKPIKVRKVKRVRKVTVGQTRDELIDSLPEEVKESVSPEIMDTLSKDELEALVGASAEEREVEEEGAAEVPSSEISELPKAVVAKAPSTERVEHADSRWEELAKAYGVAKADLLIQVPEHMLQGLPPEQILAMDMETLKGLTDALKPRE